MSDQDVRDMLRRRAADVRPSPDAFDRIEDRIASGAAAPRRHLPTVLAAAAALVAATLVTVGLVGRDDDPTSVEVGPAAPATSPAGPLLDAVWPTADEDELHRIAPDALRRPEPWPAASAYLEDRLGISVPHDGWRTDGSEEDEASLYVADGSVDTNLHLRRVGGADDPVWYVVRALNGLVHVRMASYDGERVTAEVLPVDDGELTIEVEPADASDPVISIPVGEVEAREPIALDEALPDEAGVVVRAILRTGDTVSLSDAMVPSAVTDEAPAPDTSEDDPSGSHPGIWPYTLADLEERDVDDAADVAEAYIANRFESLGDTTTSAFMQGDSNSGEITFRGDVDTTLLMRRGALWWYVAAAIHDEIATDVRDDGALVVAVGSSGTLVHTVRTPDGAEELARYDVADGDVVELGRPPQPDGASNQLSLERSDGTVALAELRAVEASPTASEVPDAAVDPRGGLDAQAVARDYLHRRLGDEVEVGELRALDDERAVVSWSGGAVELLRHGDTWYVTGHDGANVSIEEPATDEGAMFLRLVLGGAGAWEVTAHDAEGGDCGTRRGEVDEAGAISVDEAVTCDVESIRAHFTTPDGETTFAEAAL